MVLERFLMLPEITQDLSFDDGYAPFSYMVSRSIHSVLNSSSVTGFCFKLKLKKSIVMTFFWSPRRKTGGLCKKSVLQHHRKLWQKFVLQRQLKLCVKIPPYVHCKCPRQQAVWKLLSEISRTAPALD